MLIKEKGLITSDENSIIAAAHNIENTLLNLSQNIDYVAKSLRGNNPAIFSDAHNKLSTLLKELDDISSFVERLFVLERRVKFELKMAKH